MRITRILIHFQPEMFSVEGIFFNTDRPVCWTVFPVGHCSVHDLGVTFLPKVAVASSLQPKKAVTFARIINESPLRVGCWLRESPLESCRFFNNKKSCRCCLRARAAAQRWPWHQVDTKAGALTFSRRVRRLLLRHGERRG